MTIRYTALALALAFAGHPALAQKAEGAAVIASAPGKAVVAQSRKLVAKVTAVDATTREVTLLGPSGKELTVTAGPEVRNFAQIKVGDSVAVGYVEALSLKLMKGGKELRSNDSATDGARAAPGEKPGGAIAQQTRIVADVTAVDAKAQTVTLKGPKQTVDLRVPDPKQLALIKVGDQIEAVYTQAVAVSLEPAPAK